jgi:AraC-like DNA-binding protein
VAELLRRTRTETRTRDRRVAASAVMRTEVTHGLLVEGRDSSFSFEDRTRGTHLLSLGSCSCAGVISGQIAPDDAVTLIWLKSGRGHLDDEPMIIGRPTLLRHDSQPFRWESFHKDVMRIDRATVEAVAAERGDWEPGPLVFKPRHVPEGPALAAWWLMVRTVAAEVLNGPDEVSLEREQELTRFAAAGLLSSIPHWPLGQHEPPRTAASARFARAESFLLENATEQITVADVAAAAGLSVRGLQDTFQRHHGIAPLTYLRGIRLLLAREHLQTSPTASVAEVARAAGFAHLGRFAAAYRAEFGELPRQTRQAAQEA